VRTKRLREKQGKNKEKNKEKHKEKTRKTDEYYGKKETKKFKEAKR
jgi:hypothetical protein